MLRSIILVKNTVFWIVMALLCGTVCAYAEQIPKQFIKNAQVDLSHGDLEKALDAYARAFILDPQNKDILQQMLALKSDELLSPPRRLKLTQIHDQILQLNRLQESIRSYETKKTELMSALTRRGEDIEVLGLEMGMIEKKARTRRDAAMDSARQLFLQSDDPVDLVSAALTQTQISLKSDMAQLQEQMQRLKDLTQHQDREISDQLNEDEIASLRQSGRISPINIPPTRESSSSESTGGRSEIADLSLQLHETRQQVEQQSRQIRILMASLDEMKAQQDAREQMLDEKNNQITALNENLIDLQSQLMLREKIVKEKEVKIEQMQEGQGLPSAELLEANKKLMEQLKDHQRDIRQLEAMLSIYQEGGVKSERKNKETLFKTRERHESLSDLNGADGQGRSPALAQRQDKRIGEKEEQIVELKNIIEMYKTLLNDAKKDQKDTLAHLSQTQLEKSQINDSLAAKDKTLMEAEYKLLQMKKELTNVQTRFMAFKSLPLTKDYAKMEDEMDYIEGELKNIHTFLLNQLDDFEKLNSDYVAGDIQDVDRVLQLNLKRIQED